MTKHDHLHDREFALTLAMREVAAELRLVDPADYVRYISMEQYSSLEDIVNSSSELIYAPGTLSFGWGADVSLDWNERPAIALDMEFRHDSVTAFFSLALRGDREAALIRMITFDSSDDDPLVNTGRLIGALHAARCVHPR